MSNKDNKSNNVTMITTVGALTFCGLLISTIIYYKSDILDIYDTYMYGPDMITLINISKALDVLSTTVEELQSEYNNKSNNNNNNMTITMDGNFKTKLSVAHSDIDYLFDKLDCIRGNEYIKRKRKGLVETTKKLSLVVDKLIANINSSH